MKLSRPGIMLCMLLLFGLLAGWSLLGADVAKQERQPVQQGFTARFVLVERQDGSRTVLEGPHLGILGDKTYVVGRTLFLEGITNDFLFEDTIQWVGLGDARRIAEVTNLQALCGRGEHMQAKGQVFGKPIEGPKTPPLK